MVQERGKTRVKATFLYRNPPHETFAPENLNMKNALSRTDMIINRLIKKEQLEQFKEEIQKKIDIGCLERVSEEDLQELIRGHTTFATYNTYSVNHLKAQA